MEKITNTIIVVAVCWLLSLVIVAQCAIRETNGRRAAPEIGFSIPVSQQDYNTSLTGFEIAFKEGEFGTDADF